MLFRNTPRFQQVLQTALAIAAQEKGYSDDKLARSANLKTGKSTLHRFRRVEMGSELELMSVDKQNNPINRLNGVFLNGRDAETLWKYLYKNGYIDKAIEIADVFAKDLVKISDVATLAHNFFEIKRQDAQKFINLGLLGSFFCFKPSFRRKGFTVKSMMDFQHNSEGSFTIKEFQRASGVYEDDGTAIVEQSEGFGLIKSDRLWLFMRDVETAQPRLFCFNELKLSAAEAIEENAPKNDKLTMMYGHLIEGAVGNARDAFAFKIVLMAQDIDKKLWTEHVQKRYPSEDYNAVDQIDVYPTGQDQQKMYRSGKKKFYIPSGVIEYMARGLNYF